MLTNVSGDPPTAAAPSTTGHVTRGLAGLCDLGPGLRGASSSGGAGHSGLFPVAWKI